MSFSFGGLIFKQAGALDDDRAVSLIRHDSYKYNNTVTVQEAASTQLEGIGVLHWADVLIVFGSDLPYSCSFQPDQTTELNARLIKLSEQYEILCFTLNGISESYGWVFYEDGKIRRTRSVSSGEEISNTGDKTPFEKIDTMNETGMIKLIENFTGFSFSSLIEKRDPIVKVYRPGNE